MTSPHATEQATDPRPRPAAAIEEDLAFVRQVAESGRTTPLLGGRFLVLWGCTVALATVINWLIATRVLPVSVWGIPIAWFGLTGIAFLISMGFKSRLSRTTGAATIGNRVERAVWQMAGLFFSIFFFGLAALPIVQKLMGGTTDVAFYRLFSLFPPITFGVYAIAISATAAAADHRLLRVSAWVALGFLFLTLIAMNQSYQLLISATGIIFVLVVPGLFMLRDEAEFRAQHN